MDPVVFEILQILKFTFRQDRLEFTKHLIYQEEELETVDLTPAEIDRLMARGEVRELEFLVHASYDDTRKPPSHSPDPPI
jgi:hypothetical protein